MTKVRAKKATRAMPGSVVGPGPVIITEYPPYGSLPEATSKRKGVTLGVTLNLGDYESVKVQVFTERDLLPGEDPKVMVEVLGAEVFRDLKTMTTSLVQEFKALRKEAFDDLMEED